MFIPIYLTTFIWLRKNRVNVFKTYPEEFADIRNHDHCLLFLEKCDMSDEEPDEVDERGRSLSYYRNRSSYRSDLVLVKYRFNYLYFTNDPS